MLTVRDLAVDIEGSQVLRGVSFSVGAGELICLVGRNGAGKTTRQELFAGFVSRARSIQNSNQTTQTQARKEPYQTAAITVRH